MSGLLQLTLTSNDEVLGLRRGFTADSLRLERCEIVFSAPNTSTHANIDVDFLEGYNISNENASGITMALDTAAANRLNKAKFRSVEYRRVPIRDSIHVRLYDGDGQPLANVASCVVSFSYREGGR